MTIIIWKPASPQGTCRSRYKARRAARQRLNMEEQRLMRVIECGFSQLSPRVQRALGGKGK